MNMSNHLNNLVIILEQMNFQYIYLHAVYSRCFYLLRNIFFFQCRNSQEPTYIKCVAVWENSGKTANNKIKAGFVQNVAFLPSSRQENKYIPPKQCTMLLFINRKEA